VHAAWRWGAGGLALVGATVAMTEGAWRPAAWRPAAGAVPTPVDSETLSTVLFTLAEDTIANGRTGEGILDRVMWTLGKVRATMYQAGTGDFPPINGGTQDTTEGALLLYVKFF